MQNRLFRRGNRFHLRKVFGLIDFATRGFPTIIRPLLEVTEFTQKINPSRRSLGWPDVVIPLHIQLDAMVFLFGWR